MKLLLIRHPSPIGTMLLVSDGEVLRALDFHDYEDRMHRLLKRHYGTYVLAASNDAGAAGRALDAYFAGDIPALDGIAVRTGGTTFQNEVWAALRRIPAGEKPRMDSSRQGSAGRRAVRAVGAANGANPVAIVVPCHRVIGADASLTGYGGGLARKAWLLRHEAGERER